MWIELESPGVNISMTPLLQIQVSLHTIQNKVYVNKDDVTIDTKKETDAVVNDKIGGECYFPKKESTDIVTVVNGTCKIIHCTNCDLLQMLAVTANRASYTKDKPDEPEGLGKINIVLKVTNSYNVIEFKLFAYHDKHTGRITVK